MPYGCQRESECGQTENRHRSRGTRRRPKVSKLTIGCFLTTLKNELPSNLNSGRVPQDEEEAADERLIHGVWVLLDPNTRSRTSALYVIKATDRTTELLTTPPGVEGQICFLLELKVRFMTGVTKLMPAGSKQPLWNRPVLKNSNLLSGLLI